MKGEIISKKVQEFKIYKNRFLSFYVLILFPFKRNFLTQRKNI